MNFFVFGREWELSDVFVFNIFDVLGLIGKILERWDEYKESVGVFYFVFMVSDLESFFGNFV